jgi:1,4-dihydroxy-6-naphthoate synthase
MSRQTEPKAAEAGETKTGMPAKPTTAKPQELKLAHSPDADDAFMFYALATNKIRTPGLKFTHALADIESLNQLAQQEVYDVTALSFHAYAFLTDKYVLLDCGASFGESYGPLLVSLRPLKRDDLAGRRVAVPGLLTTAYLVLKLFEPRVEPVPMAFDKIVEAVAAGPETSGVDAGLLIHEGQLLYSRVGLQRVIDLGQWWHEQTSLPLPLGANAVRRALGPDIGRQVAHAVRRSVAYALEHREAALNYAMQFARDMEAEMTDKFVGMYVNRRTLEYGEEGRRAVHELLARGAKAGLLPDNVSVELLGEATD